MLAVRGAPGRSAGRGCVEMVSQGVLAMRVCAAGTAQDRDPQADHRADPGL